MERMGGMARSGDDAAEGPEAPGVEDGADEETRPVVAVIGRTLLAVASLRWVPVPVPRRLHRFLYDRRNFLLCVASALITYLVTSSQTEEISRTLAVFVFAASCWLLEVFPLPITGLMIPVLLTVLGVFGPEEAFAPFAHPVVFLMIGGLVLGQSIRRHGLDKRLAYAILAMSRGRIDRLVLLVMAATASISMWMSNTVAVAVLLPVVLSILAAMPEQLVNLRKKVLLGMTFSTTIGGMMMLTGSTPNLIAAAALEAERPFGFNQWAYYGVPVGIASLAGIYAFLRWRFPSPDVALDMSTIEEERSRLGPMGRDQKAVVSVFGLTIFLWFFGSSVETWLGLPESISSAAMVSISAVMLMFGLGLLDMRDVHATQWDIIFLLGGGLLLGEAMLRSGSAGLIGGAISGSSSGLPEVAIIALFIFITLALTNFISNTATAAVLVPIAVKTSGGLGLDPVVLVMAIGLSSSVAFITPVGTPSTAMIYSTGQVPKGLLLRTGLAAAGIVAAVTLVFVGLLPAP